jgi:hypothetical protein
MRDAAGGGDVSAERCSAVHSAHQVCGRAPPPNDVRRRILHQACGRCPSDNHLGDAESRELHITD